jgi:cytochrome P450
MLAFGAANHDPRHFPNPDVFDPRRDNAHTQLSFGWGIHFCLGAGLARIECEIVLRLLGERLPGLRLVPDQALSFPPNISFRGPHHLWVEWLARPA